MDEQEEIGFDSVFKYVKEHPKIAKTKLLQKEVTLKVHVLMEAKLKL